ncbi:tripartite tricarboxylate transporter substrate binding protein [Achromobacter aloeverae]|uniref:Twin-arginine translocation pathway signal n=1 Tax=Achromobacter aloeverae TaxID=1750518 RepID=A0A4Q1HJK1_9BURK|nr:tripartite tricarboxylate transporter substrate binding protein [Achromobacter aloeverae]RXN86743.1 Twin-arginine translocation pathway signal [Achromobacter aloeverae]
MKNLFRILAALMLMLAANASQAAWPDRPVTLIVPFTPATGIDQVARQLAATLPKTLGQAVVVENLAGASGNIGTEKVARAAPDGYTFLVTVNTFVMNQPLYREKLHYDPIQDFAPVSLTSWGTLLLVTHPSNPVGTIQQMEDAARKQPGKLSYGTPGVGTPHHLAMALLLDQAKATMLHVPYKGTAGAVTDMLAGRLDYMFLPVHVALPQIKAGKLKALATGSPKRLPQLPDVPTLSESGLHGADVDMWYGVLAPKGTPQAIIDSMNRQIAVALKAPSTASAFEAQGMVPATSTPAEFAELIRKDAKRWSDVVTRAGIKAD